jgi:aminoglycoside phosphotransferase (APT) family kinase protein
MSDVSLQTASLLCESDIARFVEQSAKVHFGNDNRVVSIERRLNDYHSSFAIEELTVCFENERRLTLIFKNLSPDGLLEYARQIRPHFSYESAREIIVYRHILAGVGLGTPTCYGAHFDRQNERYWLLLEKVAGNPLAKTGEFSIWCDAARWLAEMHCRLAEVAAYPQLVASLLQYNEAFFNAWIDRAEHFSKLRVDCANNGHSEISRLTAQCRRAVRKICSLPQTFIHGEFYASNVLISSGDDQIRICAIDWETAAIGPGLLDLAALVAGNWTEDRRTQLASAYYDALNPAMRPYANFEEFSRALRCCRLFMAIKWLGWSSDWQAPDEHRCDWLAEAMHLASLIDC